MTTINHKREGLPPSPQGCQSFQSELELPVSAPELFAWHERAGAFERLCPPWDPVEVIHSDGHIRDGAEVSLKIKLPLGLPATLQVTHEGYREGERFVDRQVRGPFSYWRHIHSVSELPHGGAQLTDDISYKLPLSPLGQLFGGAMARSRIEQLFHYRREVMRHDLSLHSAARAHGLKVAVSGASGFIGAPLCALLSTGGHHVKRLVRRASRSEDELAWPSPQELPELGELDAVIHLAGESVAQRWSAKAKRSIMNSRVERTRALAEAIASAARAGKPHPKTLICASAVGYYGDRGPSPVDEGAARGEGFLAEVCEAWERACEPAREVGVRVVHVRVGIVLAPNGGALQRLSLPFSLGLGGPVGHGEQGMSWVSLHDAVGAFYWALTQPSLSGVINAVSPQPVSSAEFAKTLGRVLKRPALLPAPAFALKLAFGEMAEEALLSGQFVQPSALLSSAYPMMHPTLEGALRFELGRAEL